MTINNPRIFQNICKLAAVHFLGPGFNISDLKRSQKISCGRLFNFTPKTTTPTTMIKESIVFLIRFKDLKKISV
jgi:hypothetical protein